MKGLRKVVWAEGVFLGQQHFQLWDRYLERNQCARSKSQSPFHWGLIASRIDEEALTNGQFRLLSCELIFPDGRLIGFDAAEGTPLLRDLSEGDAERVDIHLALPANGGVAGITGYQERGSLCTWSAAFDEVADEHDASRRREVMVGSPNLFLLRAEESREQFATLKVAELERAADGAYRLSDSFIPTVCHISASPVLRALLQRLIEMVQAKVRVLGERRQVYGRVADFGPNELSQFLLLQALAPALAMLQHLRSQPELHPERLYLELSRLVSQLCAFRPEAEVGEAPAYTHQDLTQVFARFEDTLRALLSEVLPAQSAGIKLSRENESLYAVDGIDTRTMGDSSLFLAVLHESEDPAWVSDFARQAKVGAREDIELILGSALPGIRINHTQRPPNRLPIKSGYEYFRIEPRGEFWQRACDHQSLALFLPGGFRQARVELLAVEE